MKLKNQSKFLIKIKTLNYIENLVKKSNFPSIEEMLIKMAMWSC